MEYSRCQLVIHISRVRAIDFYYFRSLHILAVDRIAVLYGDNDSLDPTDKERERDDEKTTTTEKKFIHNFAPGK